MGSYIKIHRKILEWEWYKNQHTKTVFFHCLLKAYWKDTKIEGKIIPRGSFISSIAKISEELALTPMEVKTALKHLKSTNEITSEGTNRYTIFTVTNYDLYQTEEQAKQPTDSEQTENKQKTIIELLSTNKELKEFKELKEGEEGKKGSNKEKNREKKKVDNSELLERLLPDYPVSEVLSDKIREWIAYKKAKKDTYVEQGMRSLLKKIAEKAQKYRDFTVIDLIDTCMANNWKGIIWDKLETANSRQNGAGASRNAQFDQLMEQIRKDEENADRRRQKDCSGAYGDVSRL